MLKFKTIVPKRNLRAMLILNLARCTFRKQIVEVSQMKLMKLTALVFAMGILAGCNSYSYSNVKSADPSQKVRLVTITDSDGNSLGERHEMLDTKTMDWFEATASATGSYALTPAGKAAQAQAEREAQSGGDGGGGGC